MTDEVEELRKTLKESQLRTMFYQKGIEKLKAEAESANEKWQHIYEDLYVAEIELAKFVDVILNHSDTSGTMDILRKLATEVASEGSREWVARTLKGDHDAPLRQRSQSLAETEDPQLPLILVPESSR